MNPKHSSWLDECNAGGSNMASNNEMGITSVVCVCVCWRRGVCEFLLWMLTDRDQQPACRRSTNNPCMYEVDVFGCACACACIG